MTKRFVFIMQHQPTPEQTAAAEAIGTVTQLENKKLLMVPDDPSLDRAWFVKQAEAIQEAVGGFSPNDTVQAMGQQQLANAVNALAYEAGVTLVESVTRREAVEVPQTDGSIKKEAVFRFCGFRPLYLFGVTKTAAGIIEEARKTRVIPNESANLATVALSLKGDDAMFANRMICRGSDPASLEYFLFGEISEPVRRAHTQGPGSLHEDEKGLWLTLAAASIDETEKENVSVLEKARQFLNAVNWLRSASSEEKAIAGNKELEKILRTPFEEVEVGGVQMRVYTSDRGFAAAYWAGIEYAAVVAGNIYIGSKGRSLEEIGIKVDKTVTPNFGIIFPY